MTTKLHTTAQIDSSNNLQYYKTASDEISLQQVTQL